MGKWIVGAAAFVGLFLFWVSGTAARALDEREVAWGVSIREGDLVFQDLACGERCQLIRDITDSPYSHVGVVQEEKGERVVWEAYGPVGPTPLSEWVRRGREQAVAIYRPTAALGAHTPRLLAAVETMAGRPYDGLYLWDDERIYCSELIAKAYAAALSADLFETLELQPHAVDLGPHAARVAQLSDGLLTEETLMVTPVDLVRSPGFERVVDELQSGPR